MWQMARAAGGDPEKVAARIREIVGMRGKMHNPITRSGGCLVGRVAEIGSHFPARGATVGQRICPIVSLSLIPLQLAEIGRVDIATCQVHVSGSAILFETANFGVLPDDFGMALAIGACAAIYVWGPRPSRGSAKLLGAVARVVSSS